MLRKYNFNAIGSVCFFASFVFFFFGYTITDGLGSVLTIIGWILLASLTFGIGYFFLLPYMQMASVSFYESFLENNKKEYSNSEETIEIQ